MSQPAYHLHCPPCEADFDPAAAVYTCPHCGENLDIILPYDTLKNLYTPEDFAATGLASIWRYTSLLPAASPPGETPLHSVGWTPVYDLENAAPTSGVARLLVKDESGNPTASFKDRASAVVVAHALENDIDTIITASSGNAGAALAGMAAASGLKAVILVPRTAPAAKVAQLLVFGAQVFLVDGTYDDAFDLSVSASTEFGWYCRNTGYNPLTREGKKTAALELFEQVPEYFRAGADPLHVFVPVGDGNIISGVHKGFIDLQRLGWLKSMPRIYGVQAAGSAAIAAAYLRGNEVIEGVRAETLADSISVGLPRDGLRALRAATLTGGAYLTVSDAEILSAIPALGAAGIFAEPAAAAAYAGFLAARRDGLLGSEAHALVLSTGSGLKDIPAAQSSVAPAPLIAPNLNALQRSLHL